MIYVIIGIILGILIEVIPISLGIFASHFYKKEYQKRDYEKVKESDSTRKFAKLIDIISSPDFWLLIFVELVPIVNYSFNIYLIKNFLDEKELIKIINEDVKRGVLRKMEDKNEQGIEVQVKNNSYRMPVDYYKLSPAEQKKFLMEELTKIIDNNSPEQPKKLQKK